MNFFLGTGAIALFSYLCICLALKLGQRRLIFRPWAGLEKTPAHLGLAYEDVTIPVFTWQGQLSQLHGWWLPHPRSSAVALHLHGNEGNISVNLNAARTLHEAGFSVLMIDYRGYGLSKGEFPSEAEVYRDAQAAWKYLVKNQEIAPENIFLYGHSLGGAIALDLAVRQPQVAGVIVDGTFTSIAAVAKGDFFYRLFPVEFILDQRFDSLAKLPLLRSPLLVIHGAEDRDVPLSLAEKLFNAASVPKKFFPIPCAGHNNTVSVADGAYRQTLLDFKALALSTPRGNFNPEDKKIFSLPPCQYP